MSGGRAIPSRNANKFVRLRPKKYWRCAISHVSSIKVEVKSLEALKSACYRLGLEFREGQRTYQWFNRWVGDHPLPEGVKQSDLGKCDSAIRVPGASYEVGVVSKADGGYNLLWDFWKSGGLEARLGPGGQKLIQAYSVEAALESLRMQGRSAYEETQSDGSIKLRVQVG